ncbi:zinc finger CCCH domain-containing protein 16 isoform X1 [Hordeum vulgare subsp. vulgare]|uniref:Zinc finger CCCH domain-containing protein 16 n=1 Tax=Hordeum vulgare subsp. vulgare TaxID=112509 RepID=A0A8I6Y2J8_HORVV|nr:zinc finger CCCH domain-containing protein 16 isoform X1 [Hordeum vulgare subsp. vulgare]
MSTAAADLPAASTRSERRKERKKQRRRRARREAAAAARAAAEALAADPEEGRRLRELEEAEADASDRARRAFEDAERRWLEKAASRAAEEAAAEEEACAAEASTRDKYNDDHRDETEEDGEWEYVEDGPAEIIWQGNEIIVKKKKVKIPKKAEAKPLSQEEERPTSNPLPPQSVAVDSQRREPSLSARELLEKVAQETPNFGTEQDKAHCPFYLKTAACRFGVRCSRVHFYPDKSCTLLMKNMYNGPGLVLEQDEGLEFTDEEIEQSYEEFYEDVHTEFLKFGELVNFKVCRNGSFHLRGNVYVHYKALDSALLAYNSMNGRYFAGKQITCEFVALTKWKSAICGEYMRSRFKTCSHGVACNFIHCFRNPGGDYEWADWDNPPPKYWTRKMAALFGPSDDAVFDKASDAPDFERLHSSDRKRLRSSDGRYISSRHRDGDAHKRHSSRVFSHSKQEQSNYIMKYGHTRHSREPSTAKKQRGHEIEDDIGRYCSPVENERVSQTHKREEKHRDGHGDGARGDNGKIKSRKHRSEQHESLESGCSDWPSEFADAGTSRSPSCSKSTNRYSNHNRSRGQSLDDSNLERGYSTADKSSGKAHIAKSSSRHYVEDDSYGEKGSGRDKSGKHSDHCDDPDDRWLATTSDVDSDGETQFLRSSSGIGKGGKNDNAPRDEDDRCQRSSSRSARSRANETKSSRKRKKHHSEIRKNSDSDDSPSDSSDIRDSSSHAWRSRSRSSEEDLSLHRRRKGRLGHDS